jgi:tRNA dimethylallyltransferase
MSKTPPLIAIVGPTASGKTALALTLAQRHSGEIIAADSRTIYKGMDIGTAKPTIPEQLLVPHHGLDVVEPGEPFSASTFKELANRAINGIAAHGNLPLLVGGTGLYIDAVLYDYQFPTIGNLRRRDELQELSVDELQAKATELGISLNDSDWQNPRRLMRAIETEGVERDKRPLRENTLILGLMVDRSQLEERIRRRVEDMIASGFQLEVERLINAYGPDSEAMSGIGYRAFTKVVQGTATIDAATEEFVRGDMNLAKRQMTWFKRNPDTIWCHSQAEAIDKAEAFLSQNT